MVAIVSDTHVPKGSREIPARCLELMSAADLIVHAGDWSAIEVVDRIAALGPPLVAVHGNVERPEVRKRLPARTDFSFGGHQIGVIHDAGPRRGRAPRMRRAFPDASAVIFGHSHIPLHEIADDGLHLFNPGSPTERRRSPQHSMGTLDLDDSGAMRFEHITL